MKIDEFKALEVGDRIEFRSQTRHNNRKAIRKITGFPKTYKTLKAWSARHPDYLFVRYEGTPVFYVHRDEVIRKVA